MSERKIFKVIKNIPEENVVVMEDRGEADLTRQLEEKDKLIQELRMRIRDMLLISEQHRNILGAEITDRKRLQQEVKDLKVQMSEYLSVRVKGARDNAG